MKFSDIQIERLLGNRNPNPYKHTYRGTLALNCDVTIDPDYSNQDTIQRAEYYIRRSIHRYLFGDIMECVHKLRHWILLNIPTYTHAFIMGKNETNDSLDKILNVGNELIEGDPTIVREKVPDYRDESYYKMKEQRDEAISIAEELHNNFIIPVLASKNTTQAKKILNAKYSGALKLSSRISQLKRNINRL